MANEAVGDKVDTVKFMPGLELCERFYHDAVRPILDRCFPGLVHSAARLYTGSEVLGFDTPASMDHCWGPRTTLYLSEDDCDRLADQIREALSNELPREICGFPTHYEGAEICGGVIQFKAEGPISHGVDVCTTDQFFTRYIGVNPLAGGMSELDWLLIWPQHLRTIASGRVFHDGLGELSRARELLAWYPHDVWLFVLACQWRKISQEEPFMARCGDVGDELGSRLVASRMIKEIMWLCFLMEKQYAPYYKWFGTAFSRLRCAKSLTPIFHKVFSATDWKERERWLSEAYLHVARMHNDLHLTEDIPAEVSAFGAHRPYQVLHSERFVDALRVRIKSETVRGLGHPGAVWQFADSTDLYGFCKDLRAVYLP